jgi:hypothetical protein
MSEAQKYTAEDIRLYLEGKLLPSQMHALEKAALNDPFLADALEGMEHLNDQQKFSADVQELNARLHERVKNKERKLISADNIWWKAAAILFIIITGVAVIIFTGQKNKVTNEYAKKEDTQQATHAADSAPAENLMSTQTIADSQKKVVSETNKTNIRRKQAEVHEEHETDDLKENEVKVIKSIPLPAIAKDSVVHIESSAPAKRDEAAKQPVALQGKAAGIEINQSENDSSFDEVVVVGYGTSKKSRSANQSDGLTGSQTKKRIIPGNGWTEFETYIQQNKHINSADSIITGEEQLAFIIGDDGLPDSIKILNSLSPSHDKEVIRLLENGPSWKVIKGRKKQVKLKIIF